MTTDLPSCVWGSWASRVKRVGVIPELAGRLETLTFDSTLLRNNPLGDPHERPLWVQLPPGYDDSDRRYPVVHVLQGFGGTVPGWLSRSPYKRTLPERVDELLGDSAVPPFIVVYSDSWTRYGSSQFVDSAGTGPYHSYFCNEIVPYVDEHYRTLPAREHRAVTGKSSGGFGAMITPMLRPDLFGALASHAGDTLYETNYLREVGAVARALREYDGDIMNFWADFESRWAFSKASDMTLWLFLGISSCFSADEDGVPQLPFDSRTGRIREDVWARWLGWDPVRMLAEPTYAESMRRLHSIWIDAGSSDDFFLDLGAQAFRDGLREVGVDDAVVAFELVDANHSNIDHRYIPAMRWLADRIA